MISRLRYTFREMWASLSRNLTLTVGRHHHVSTISLLLFGGSRCSSSAASTTS